MAAGVALDQDRSWLKPGRTVERLFDRAREQLAPGSEIDEEFEAGLANGLLTLNLLRPELADDIRTRLVEAAKAEVSDIDAADSRTDQDAGYRAAMVELIALLEQTN